MTRSPIKTCVIGVGLAGTTFHIPFILSLPQFTLTAVLERNPSTEGGKVKERFGVSVKIHNDLDAVLSDPEIELVIVGSPNHTHFQIAKSVLNAGKHVLVDKPVTTSSAEAKELGEIAKSKGLVLYAFQNRRWDADFLALKKLLDLPETSPHFLGSLVEFESHYDRYRTAAAAAESWKSRPDAGATYNLGTHIIDQAHFLFGKPQKLTAFLDNVRGLGDADVDDCFTIYMHYPAGPAFKQPFTVILRSHILSARSPQVRFIARGTRGTFTKFGVDGQEDQLKSMQSPSFIHSDEYGVEPEALFGQLEILVAEGNTTKATWPSESPGQYQALFLNLAAAIRDGEELAVKWEEAIAVLEIIELAIQSSKTGRTVSFT